MPQAADQDMQDQAIAWHLRTCDGADADWDAFVAWLEADPRHNSAYESVIEAEADLDRLDRLLVMADAFANEPAARRQGLFRGSGWRIGALAASVTLALIGTWVVIGRGDPQREIATAPGKVRTLAFADGTRIVVNGATRVLLHSSDPRRAELETGEAQFSVRHDPAHPFSLKIGSQRIVDTGTVFNVVRTNGTTRVQVAEGSVEFQDGDIRLPLEAGSTLLSRGNRLVEGSMATDAIGSWTRGVLIYRQAPLGQVFDDLSRNRGIAITVSPAISRRTFSGVIQLDGDDGDLRRRAGRLLGIRIVKAANGWAVLR